ncbi:MAG TPA: hypothetical protein VFO16_06100 [Pseudonocardiaceae bacterium]|nr:hypothetical protein [Pseudonocardiaceae bacterium]
MSRTRHAAVIPQDPAKLINKLEQTVAECRETIRLAHEARRDLRTELNQLNGSIAHEIERIVTDEARQGVERLNRDLTRLTDRYAVEIQAKFDKLIMHLIGICGQSELDRIVAIGDVDQTAMVTALRAAFTDH